ncbi:MAG: sugar phosphate isomerase/epimerase [Fimbriimonadaceae bacterium]|nr:sugar phosphate isomerase/epimerase [Fimbriimonadaceae bacterium]
MKLSVQLFTLRDQCDADLPGTLNCLRQMDLNYVELAGFAGRSASEFRKLLDDHGLKASGAHVGIGDLESDFDTTIDAYKTVGTDQIFVPWIGKDAYENGWASFADRMNKMGARVQATGLQLGYHNHAFEFALEGGRPGLDVFYEAANPEYVKAQIDVYWVLDGGQNPAEYVRKLKGRVPSVHLKDGDGKQPPTYLEAGRGVVDWDSVLAACTEAGVEFGSIELDTCIRPGLEMVRESVEFFRSKGVSE